MMTIALLLFATTSLVHGIGCLNHLGQSVDWWIGIKMPAPHGSKYVAFEPGRTGWYAGKDMTSTENNHLANTLNPLYRLRQDTGFVAYNDELPPADGGHIDSVRAHAKGTFGLGTEKGFWPVHSVPKFPNNPSDDAGYLGILSGQQKYAQSFLCVSLNASDLDGLASLLHAESLPEEFLF